MEDEGHNGDQQFAQDAAEYGGAGGDEFTTTQTAGEGGNNPGSAINASKNDDDERKIFVGGLSWETTVKDLREYFEKYGTVADCTLKTDPTTGRSRGFGFVMYEDPYSVDKTLAEKGHHLHGRNIDPKRAKARGGKEPIKKVFVGGLDPTTPESDLREHFGQFGKIEEIDLPYDKIKNQRRAFCFITFDTEETVDRVCQEQKQKINDKDVDVKKATPKEQQQGFGRGGGRGGFSGPGSYQQGGQQGWGGQQGGYDYNNYYNQGYGGNGYDYNQYPGYDYNNYYNQGWGGYNQGGYGGGYGQQGYGNQGYGGDGSYDYSGWYGQNNQNGGGQQGAYGGKAKRGGGSSGSQSGYHPYSREGAEATS